MFFFFNDTATTEIYTLSLHDALPISIIPYDRVVERSIPQEIPLYWDQAMNPNATEEDRKSTRLNSSHSQISYAVFCLKKKKKSCMHEVVISMLRQTLTNHTAATIAK